MVRRNKYIIIILVVILFLSVEIITLLLLNSNNISRVIVSTNNNLSVSTSISSKKLIVLISLDGFGSSLIGENTPYINSIMSNPNTSYTLDMQTLTQSETMPSHMSMVTGLTQEHHGFYANSVDSTTPKLSSKTIFDYGVDNGFSLYSLVTKEKMLYLTSDMVSSNNRYVDGLSSDVLDDIDTLVEPIDSKVLVFIHLKDLDTVGHASGWGLPLQDLALRKLDSNLEILFNDLEEEFNSYQRYFIVTADHGGEGLVHSSGCPDCRRIPLIVESENTNNKYILNHSRYNIYDTACIVINMMELDKVPDMDCKR